MAHSEKGKNNEAACDKRFEIVLEIGRAPYEDHCTEKQQHNEISSQRHLHFRRPHQGAEKGQRQGRGFIRSARQSPFKEILSDGGGLFGFRFLFRAFNNRVSLIETNGRAISPS